jgi:hypothetical protein
MFEDLSIGFPDAAPPIAWICVAQADRTAGLGVGVPPGMLGAPSAPTTGSGIHGIPCCRAQATAARQAAKLSAPDGALARVWVPPPRLGTVVLLLDDPQAASAIADSRDTGIRWSERFMVFLSRRV